MPMYVIAVGAVLLVVFVAFLSWGNGFAAGFKEGGSRGDLDV